jgi:glutaredoxin
MTTVTIYTKPGCHLCEEAEEVIEAVRAQQPFDIERRNILDDAADYERYKHDIPVILLNGREIARHHLGEAQLVAALSQA